jgi:hypothetical protein
MAKERPKLTENIYEGTKCRVCRAPIKEGETIWWLPAPKESDGLRAFVAHKHCWYVHRRVEDVQKPRIEEDSEDKDLYTEAARDGRFPEVEEQIAFWRKPS